MPFVPAPNIVQVEILAQKDGALIENRIMVNVFHAPTLADLTAVAAVVTPWIVARYAPNLPADVTITGLRLSDMSQQNGPFLQPGLAIPGEKALPAMPNEVTYCISLRTGSAGRSGRGRFYVLGLARVDVATTNRVAALYRTEIVEDMAVLITDLVNAGFAWVIVSHFNNNALRPGGPVYFPVTNVTTTDDVVDSQRRRRPGVGA